ncbi:MAG TPA: hypothetical protein VFN78_02270, partial [Ktedonobacterales bacterium]|nr:hypothetical protein [Ktedonobacterales bacterium]
ASPTRNHGVRVKAFYLALGDSLAHGEQPYSQPYDQGYAQQWFALLHQEGSRSLTDYGCPGVTSGGFIAQSGRHWTPSGTNLVLPAHNAYEGTQLAAAVAFIKAHRNKVSPVSLDIGANDLVQALQYGGGWMSGAWCGESGRAIQPPATPRHAPAARSRAGPVAQG